MYEKDSWINQFLEENFSLALENDELNNGVFFQTYPTCHPQKTLYIHHLLL